MSRDSPQTPPPEVRDALGEETDIQPPDEDDLTIDELWSLLESVRVPSSALPDASETWKGIRQHIEAEDASTSDTGLDESRSQRPPRSGSRRRVGRRAAAAVVVLLFVGLGAWLWSRPIEVTATPGASITHTLPDGSVVELNGGTRLTYGRTMSTLPFLEDRQRRVRVQGEAYFEVVSGERPFVVETPTARIEVVGTAFAVQTNADTENTHVALAEGTVQVQARDTSDEAVRLRPGQAIEVGPRGLASAPADTSIERVTAWRRGGFAVTAQALPEIAKALEQQFGTPVQLSPAIPNDVTSAPLTLYYSQDVGVETILHDISMARDLSYRPTPDNGYVLASSESRSSSGSNTEP